MDGFAAQGGNTEADPLALAKIGELIREVQGDDAMVAKFVLIVETFEEDDTYISTFTSPGLKEWQSMGLLHWALDAEGRTRLTNEEEDD